MGSLEESECFGFLAAWAQEFIEALIQLFLEVALGSSLRHLHG